MSILQTGDSPDFLSQVSGELQRVQLLIGDVVSAVADLEREVVRRLHLVDFACAPSVDGFARALPVAHCPDFLDTTYGVPGLHDPFRQPGPPGPAIADESVSRGYEEVLLEVAVEVAAGSKAAVLCDQQDIVSTDLDPQKLEEFRSQFERLDKDNVQFISIQELYTIAFTYHDKLAPSLLHKMCKYLDTGDINESLEVDMTATATAYLARSASSSSLPAAHGLNLASFVAVRTGDYGKRCKPSPELHETLSSLALALELEHRQYKVLHNASAYKWEQRRHFVKLAMDIGIVFVIAANALAIGISLDNDPNAMSWQILEVCFFVIYFLEFIIKMIMLGPRNYFTGAEMSWNLFDVICLVVSSGDLMASFLQSDEGDEGPSWTLLKVLRLTRLVRLVRLMRFKMFNELKLMFQGLLSGMRALGWALVMLITVIYGLSIITRTFFSDIKEFTTINYSMFTLFRCFTDACETLDGVLLPEFLYQRHGTVFQVSYTLIMMLINVGLFNLIMAVFIDNVTKSQNSRKAKELGETAASVECQLKIMLAKFINEPTSAEGDSKTMMSRLSEDALKKLRSLTEIGHYRNQADLRAAADASFKILHDSDIVITRAVFQAWLRNHEFVRVLEEADVDISNKFELFNILDVDHGGELSANELLTGLMSLRGDVSKGDVVSILLRVRDLTERLEAITLTLHSQRPPSGSTAAT
eukprot:TRINITY_DN20603_c0_g1_i2.p1 TRINITY_DN20603_c0_g1~~TRINITY_DN20603_c0_g1_i2.p1  ORF type:complete len:700 (+),score=103.24 TRINITY_DN20603_c0_g1_i2:131-2230(+)